MLVLNLLVIYQNLDLVLLCPNLKFCLCQNPCTTKVLSFNKLGVCLLQRNIQEYRLPPSVWSGMFPGGICHAVFLNMPFSFQCFPPWKKMHSLTDLASEHDVLLCVFLEKWYSNSKKLRYFGNSRKWTWKLHVKEDARNCQSSSGKHLCFQTQV